MKFLASAVFAFLLAGGPVFGDETSKNAKIEELVRLINVDQMMGQMIEQMKAMQMAELSKAGVAPEDRQTMQETQQKIFKVIQDALSWDKMKPMVVKIYADTFTEEEVDGILSFYKSSPGQAMLQKMPSLMQQSMAMSQRMMADVTPQIQKLMQDMPKKAGQQTNAPNTTLPDQKSNAVPADWVRIERRTAEANLVHKVEAQYPPLAMQAGVKGDVDFDITIDREGHVTSVQLLRGHPILVNAAKEALLQWIYRPILRDGTLVVAKTSVTVTFH